MISSFKLFPYFNISQNFFQNVRKPKKKHLCLELRRIYTLKLLIRMKRVLYEKNKHRIL